MKKPGVREIKRNFGVNMPKLKSKVVEGDKFFYSVSFDIDDFIGDGVWWLEIYDSHRNKIYDKPLASSMGKSDMYRIEDIIKQEFLTYR